MSRMEDRKKLPGYPLTARDKRQKLGDRRNRKQARHQRGTK